MRDLHRRHLVVGAAAVLALPGRLRAQAADPRLAGVAPGLRPPVQAMLRQMGDAPPPATADGIIAQGRRAMASFTVPPLATVPWRRQVIPAVGGAPAVTVYVINQRPGGAARPAILHTHGGCYIAGTAAQGIAGLQATAAALDCVIVTVDYRLAPQTSWQGATDDTYTGLLWLHGQAGALGVDTRRIAVMGESAGGGHAALLAIRARDRGQVPLVAQVLVYPMLDDRTGSTVDPAAGIGRLVWTRAMNHVGWGAFLGQAPGGAGVPAAAVPARTPSLAGLPPTFIGVGGIDLFVDEDVEYARRLIDAGVATELLVVPGAYHGFDLIAATAPAARGFTAAKLDALRRAFTTG